MSSPLSRHKTEMVGSLVVPTDMMVKGAGTPQSTREVVNHAVEHFGEDLKRSVNLQKRKTEMYGTLIVNAMDESTSGTSNPPSSPGRKNSRWNEPMDDVRFCVIVAVVLRALSLSPQSLTSVILNPQKMIEDVQDFLFGL